MTSKLPNVGHSIFTTISQLANEYKAVNLSQGFPNFDVDPKLIELVSEALKKGHNQYAPMQGDFELRETIAQKIESLYGRAYHPVNEITLTAGATQAIFTAISAFIKSDDEVIIFKPAYDAYEPSVILNGGKIVPVQLKKDHSINWESFKAALSSKTKMVIINSPHNPSGAILSNADLLELEVILKDRSVIVLSDEVYEHLVFDGQRHESIARYPELAKRSLICASFGKTFHVTGWKLGYCVAPKELMQEFQKVHQFVVFAVNHPMQKAIANYLKNEEHYLQLNQFYQQKRDYFLEAIKSSRFTFSPASGTYFQLLQYDKITDEPDIEFATRLITDYKIASIPISVFNHNGIDHKQLRFCFAKTNQTLDKAAEILNAI
ncbi:methionine aminotransferase [Croceivirga thetidis]|uniref:Aminotransferase class I/II-fold pyridoxal phosphate-dependent enzyme n=1 Tax=Croceivirga thetidis TaxID=2721623 RepID=A0ABX1GMJ6_9FLAO|nr:methionine aminotransferase [Croceivirga thetidis]NKI31133.1 aminotransferase class I/II-fold pyridoxal phosphate-dependent enzyme [Croceivirga thetidis]